MLPIILGCSIGNAAILLSINSFSYLEKLRNRELFENSTFKDNAGSFLDNGESLLSKKRSYFSFESFTPNFIALIATIGLFAPLIGIASAYSMELKYELSTIPAIAALLLASCYATYRGVNGYNILPKCMSGEADRDIIIYNPNSALARTDIEGSLYR